ncbi:MAG: M48 family metallopeptidase [Candidatus Didemnitutus sp.]|nr:M48 family metallopeptidase [Candidatus Didemnitutus sp.]
MDFFEAQARARSRTQRLVFLFALAVLGTIAAGYVAALLIVGQVQDRSDEFYDEPSSLIDWDPQLFAGVALATLAVVGLASLYKWSQMRAGGSTVAEMVGGRRINPQTTDLRERRLLNVVEEMAVASGVPVPAVYLLENEPGINAFAAGLTTSDAVVAVTRGTLDKLTRDELQGVVAHEFSHILNGDMRLNVKLSAIVFGILVLGLMGRGILYSLGRGRVRGGGKDKGGGIAVVVAVGIAFLIIGYIGYFFGRLIQAAVSRQREFLADASAVQFTRNPAGVSGVLKKIGGYALGSKMTDKHAGEIGHFFFAQGFRSSFGGLWATHPPLAERIRAVEPRWDGELFEPPELVDVSSESFSSAGVGGAPKLSPRNPDPLARIPFVPLAIMAEIGALTETHFRRAQSLLETIPASLREAARDPLRAEALVYALLLDSAEPLRHRQFALIEQHAGEIADGVVRAIYCETKSLDPAARLPVVQLCLPALRKLERTTLDLFVSTLDELVHADEKVSPFEFALQKMLVHQLELMRRPRQAVEFRSFKAVENEILVVMSALARFGSADETAAQRSFALGATQVKLLDHPALLDAESCTLERLDAALERLATSSLPIKQRVLAAATHIIGADGAVTVEEGELYRAIAATLDCPAPALPAAT